MLVPPVLLPLAIVLGSYAAGLWRHSYTSRSGAVQRSTGLPQGWGNYLDFRNRSIRSG